MVLSLWLVLDGTAGVVSISVVVDGVDFCAATGADVFDLLFVGVIVVVVVVLVIVIIVPGGIIFVVVMFETHCNATKAVYKLAGVFRCVILVLLGLGLILVLE